jgi:cell division protein ZapA
VERQSTSDTSTTEVEIFGTVYHVRGRDDGGYLKELARKVDQTMREVASRIATVDTAKIAILAALNLADELSRCQMQQGEQGGSEEIEELEERVAALAEELTAALDG